MNKKYELTDETKLGFGGVTLYRIKALIDIERYSVKAGDLGGWIEKEENLSQEGDAWISDNAQVYGNARVFGDAWVHYNAQIYGHAQVFGDAIVSDDARVCGDAMIFENAKIYGHAMIRDNAWVNGNARICGEVTVGGNNFITSNSYISG